MVEFGVIRIDMEVREVVVFGVELYVRSLSFVRLFVKLRARIRSFLSFLSLSVFPNNGRTTRSCSVSETRQ